MAATRYIQPGGSRAVKSYDANDPRTGFLQEANPPQVPDRDRRIPPKLNDERGSIWPSTRLFSWYEEGLIFLQGPVEDFEIEAMLKTDGKIKAVEEVLTLPIRGAKWVIEANGASKEVMDYVHELLTATPDQGGMQTPLTNVVASTAMAQLYRASCFEKVYKLNDDGLVIYDKIAYRPPTTCYLARLASTAELRGFLQWTWVDIASFEKIYIPAAKAFTYLHGTHRDPVQGTSEMDVCLREFRTKQKLRFLWAAYMENQVTPKAVGTVPSGDQQEAADLANKAASLRGGDAIGLTQGQTLVPFNPSFDAGAVFAQAIAYCDEEIYASVLANFLALATASGVRGGGGSYALSLSQTDFYLQSRWAVLGEIGDAITHQLIAPMVKWNFGHAAKVPKFRFVALAPTSNITEAMVQIITALAAVTGSPGSPPPLAASFIDQIETTVGSQFGLNEDDLRADVVSHRAELEKMYAQKPVGPPPNQLDAATDVLATHTANALKQRRHANDKPLPTPDPTAGH